MPSDIEVTEQCAKTVAGDLGTISTALRDVDFFAGAAFDADGGEFLTRAGEKFRSVAAFLSQQYGDLGAVFGEAEDATLSMWRDFRDADETARAKYDAYRDKVGDTTYGVPTLDPLAPPEPAAVTTHPHPSPASSRVSSGSLLTEIHDPQVDTGWIEALNTYNDLKDKVDYVLGFEWVVGPLQNVGLHVPIDRFKEWMEGNYQGMAEEAAKYFALSDFFEQLETDLGQVSAELGPRWRGLSSTALQDWCDDVAGKAGFHVGQLNATANAIVTQGIALKLVVDQLIDLLEDIVDLMPVLELNLDNAWEFIKSVAKSVVHEVMEAIQVIARFIGKFFLRLELLYDAIWGFLALLSSAPNDLELGPVRRPGAA